MIHARRNGTPVANVESQLPVNLPAYKVQCPVLEFFDSVDVTEAQSCSNLKQDEPNNFKRRLANCSARMAMVLP